MNKIISRIIFAFALLLAASSCYKQDDVYKEFVVSGGYIYPAKPVNLTYVPGYKRVVLKWDRPYDPAVKTAKVFWENYTDSMSVDYAQFPDGKAYVSIENLQERSYTFDVVDYDSQKHASLATEITASPYGDFWLSALSERRLKQARLVGDSATVVVSSATDQMVNTQFRYKDATSGEMVDVEEPIYPGTDTLYFPHALKGSKFEYRSCFCPPNGADTVWSAWVTTPVAIEYKLPVEAWTVEATKNQINGTNTPDKIFDGITDKSSSRYHSSTNSSYRRNFPKVLAIDTHVADGDAVCISSFEIYEHNTTQNSRYIKSYRLYSGTEAFDPDDENYSVNYGEYIAIGELDRLSAMQTGSSVLEKFGRYFALVFLDSYHTYGYIDLWEFVPYGYLQSEAK